MMHLVNRYKSINVLKHIISNVFILEYYQISKNIVKEQWNKINYCLRFKKIVN